MNRALTLLALAACTPDPLPDSAAPYEPCTSAGCVQAGVNAFDDGQVQRELHVWMPEDPRGAPVLFVWHHLGGSPEELLSWLPLDQAVHDGFIVVVPRSTRVLGTEWTVVGTPGANPDVALFDAVLASLIEQAGADADRVYTTGFSAGGLFTSYLTMHRSNRLAATAPFSGGAPAGSYTTPARHNPVMLSWGGTSDRYGGFDFDDATRNLARELRADGSPVLTCNHNLGHWLPDDALDRTLTFFIEHANTGEVASFTGCERTL